MCTEQQAAVLLQPLAATLCDDVVRPAWADFLAERRIRSSRTRAMIVHDYMVEHAGVHLPQFGSVQTTGSGGIPMWVVGGAIAIRFKKHDRELNTANILTDHQADLQAQHALPGFPPAITYLTVGYILDPTESVIDYVVAAKHVHRSLEWWINLETLANAGPGYSPVTAPLPGIGPAPLTGTGLPTIVGPEGEEAEEAQEGGDER